MFEQPADQEAVVAEDIPSAVEPVPVEVKPKITFTTQSRHAFPQPQEAVHDAPIEVDQGVVEEDSSDTDDDELPPPPDDELAYDDTAALDAPPPVPGDAEDDDDDDHHHVRVSMPPPPDDEPEDLPAVHHHDEYRESFVAPDDFRLSAVPAPPTEVDDVLDADEDEAARNRRLEREARRNARKHNA